MTVDHQVQLEQQITRAWQRYCTASLEGRDDEARLAYAQMDRLTEQLPIPPQRAGDLDL